MTFRWPGYHSQDDVRGSASTTTDLAEEGWGEVADAMAGKYSVKIRARRRVMEEPFFIYLICYRIVVAAMATFKKVCQLLLESYNDRDISEDNFLILLYARLARGKFELTNQDSAGGKNSSVLTSS